MTLPFCPELPALLVATLGLGFLYGGAPLAVAIPLGALLWLTVRGLTVREVTVRGLTVRGVTVRGLAVRRVPLDQTTLVRLLFSFVALYPVYIGVMEVSYWRAGEQGIDFGIFSQIIYQVAENNRFFTSLIATQWQNFITHHFSPFLFILGGVVKLGISPQYALIGAHVVAVAAIVLGLSSLWRISGSPAQCALLTATALLLPGVRRGLGWETHDEVLALPLLLWSLAAHLKGRTVVSLALLLTTLLFKETFGLVVFATALAYSLDQGASQRVGRWSSRFFCLLVALAGLAAFIIVTKVFPWWLWVPTFDPSTRIASPDELLAPALLWAKIRWSVVVLLPMVPFIPLHTKATVGRALVLAAPAFFSLAAIAITNFPAMFDPGNYYSITPAIILFVALSYPVLKHPTFSSALLCSLILALTIGSRVRSSRVFKEGFGAPSAYDELRALVPQEANVVVDDYTASVLATNSWVERIFHARRTRPNFDYIVVKKSLPDHLSAQLKERSVPCHETPRYLVRCAVSHREDKVKNVAPSGQE